MIIKAYNKLVDKAVHKKIIKKYKSQLQKFHNIHAGKRCFIIGNGPSLRMEDLEKLKNEYTFGANKIFVAFTETSWRPTYYCIQDFVMINNELESLKNLNEIDNKFIAGNQLIRKNIILPDWNYFYINIENFYPKPPKFSADISEQIYEGYTVTYAEIQLAIYMGFKEIYLLGVDFNYSSTINHDGSVTQTDSANYFSEKYQGSQEFGKQLNHPNLESSLLAYMAAKEYANKNDIKIYNATRGGKLNVFEKIDFDSIM